MTVKLTTPRLRVVLGDPEDESTWTELHVQTIGRDVQATEELLGQLKRGTFSSSPIAAQAMLAYFASRRSGQVEPGMTWPQFQETYLEVSDVAADTDPADGDDAAGPTPRAAGPEFS